METELDDDYPTGGIIPLDDDYSPPKPETRGEELARWKQEESELEIERLMDGGHDPYFDQCVDDQREPCLTFRELKIAATFWHAARDL